MRRFNPGDQDHLGRTLRKPTCFFNACHFGPKPARNEHSPSNENRYPFNGLSIDEVTPVSLPIRQHTNFIVSTSKLNSGSPAHTFSIPLQILSYSCFSNRR